MGIIRQTPSEQDVQAPVPNEQKIQGPVVPVEYKTPVVDTKIEPVSSLLTYVEGARWKVTYYQQVIDRDSELEALQTNLNPVYQQYIKINQLEFKVNQELSQSQNEESKSFDVTGSATLYPPMVPNAGDMFIADVGDGRAGVFAVTRTTKRTILKQACYEIEYVQRGFADANQKLREKLEERTIKETYFVKSYLEYGENPVVVTEEYEQQHSLGELYYEIINQYLADFFSRRFQTLLVPHQTEPTYDPFVTEFITAMIGTDEHDLIARIKVLNVATRPAMKVPTLFNCLLDFTDDMLPLCCREMKLARTTIFGRLPYYQSISFSGIPQVVYPAESRTDVDAGYDYLDALPGLTEFIPGKPRRGEDDSIPPEYTTGVDDDGHPLVPDIHPTTTDGCYVFTRNFYDTTDQPLSKLEALVREGLRNGTVDVARLTHLVTTCREWGSLERFYYVPIMIALIKVAKREI